MIHPIRTLLTWLAIGLGFTLLAVEVEAGWRQRGPVGLSWWVYGCFGFALLLALTERSEER